MLMACGNSGKQTTVEYIEEAPITTTDSIAHEDTVDVTTEKQADKSVAAPVSSSDVTHHHSGAHDNMRGFDPASEDDMDDNGMSRYFDNNDDEGWD